MMERWSGYVTQTEAWQRGYDWGWGQGEHGELTTFEAVEAYGYDYGSNADVDFEKGAEFALMERGIEVEDDG